MVIQLGRDYTQTSNTKISIWISVILIAILAIGASVFLRMANDKPPANDNLSSISQTGSAAKNLIQVGRDYVRYLKLQIDSGNLESPFFKRGRSQGFIFK